jgi:hypothetical protein
MRLDVITDHTEKVLNLMMDKAIRECDPEYGRVADTWYTMAEGALFLWQELAECCTEVSEEEKIKWPSGFAILSMSTEFLCSKKG